MRDIVIIPTFDRPEYLWVCLENLYSIPDSQTKEIWVCEDIHADKPKGFTTEIEMLATLREWEKKFPFFRYVSRPSHTTFGNSYNVLMALCEAAALSDTNLVYLLEDDVLVTYDFFAWNEQVQAKFFPWASCAGRLNRSLNFEMNGREAISESLRDTNACAESVTAYNSWATCFSNRALKDIAGLNFNFNFRPGYEQDQIIQSMIRRCRYQTIWPYIPRAYHMGWYSYHLDGGMKFYGTLEEKVKALQAAVTNSETIRRMAGIASIDAFPKKQHDPATDLYLTYGSNR